MKRKNLSTYLLITAVLLVAALTLAGCASAGTGANTAAAATTAIGTNPASKNEILIESNAFKPDSITIKVGDTITWTNKDSYSHTVKAKNGEFDSGDMASGTTFNFTFTKEGTYDYICGIHTFMKGTIIVTK